MNPYPEHTPPWRTQHRRESMQRRTGVAMLRAFILVAGLAAVPLLAGVAAAQQKPNIILILSDDFGYGDSGPYGGGPGRGMPTPNLDRLANEAMTFFSFYAQPSCTPDRTTMQTTGRFQPQRHDHGGIPATGRRLPQRQIDRSLTCRSAARFSAKTMRCTAARYVASSSASACRARPSGTPP